MCCKKLRVMRDKDEIKIYLYYEDVEFLLFILEQMYDKSAIDISEKGVHSALREIMRKLISYKLSFKNRNTKRGFCISMELGWFLCWYVYLFPVRLYRDKWGLDAVRRVLDELIPYYPQVK